MLNARQLDLAVLFDTHPARRWSVTPLLEEKLFLIQARGAGKALPRTTRLKDLRGTRLILPSESHGLRSTLDAAFARLRVKPEVTSEIDSLTMLMDAVTAGLAATIQPWAALGRFTDAADRFELSEIADAQVVRLNSLCSLSDDELSPSALAVRVVLAASARELVEAGRWGGARLTHHGS
jgi:LysR family tcuABC transcriptional regulator